MSWEEAAGLLRDRMGWSTGLFWPQGIGNRVLALDK